MTTDTHTAAPFLWPREASAADVAPGAMPCPNCGAAGEKPVICVSAPEAERPWRLLGCPACGAGFYEDQALVDYAAEGMSALSTTYFLQQGAALGIFADILAHIRKGPGACYVEIGCGFGFGLDVARHAMGWQARGMDPAALSILGRQLLGLDIAPDYFDPTTVADASCDVVMATEVLEHLPDPLAFLREIRRGLAPDGIAVLTTPDVAAVRPGIAKPVLQATMTVGLHLILQSAASLEFLLRRAGFNHTRVMSDGWTLTAFASRQPLDLEDEAAVRQGIVVRYLAARAASRVEADDLYIGFAGRALFAAVSAGDREAARLIWERLNGRLRERYGIEIDTIAMPVMEASGADEAEMRAALPFNLAVIMLARAYQRLAEGEPRAAFLPRFRAISSVCTPLLRWLEGVRINDMQTRQILWVAEAEAALCLAAGGSSATIGALARLGESPTGAGRQAIILRAHEYLIHAERPFLAEWLAKAEGTVHIPMTGPRSFRSLASVGAREVFYRMRQGLRGG